MDPRHLRRLVVAVAVVLPALAGAAGAAESPAAKAVTLYDDGRYAEARVALEALDAEGRMNGPLLYRLYYCQSYGGDNERSRATLERALEKLEYESTAMPSLETAFYLVNTYASLSRPDDARGVAADAVGKLESAAWPAPKDGISSFQAGRLYQILGRVDEAATRFETALRGFASLPGRYTGPTLFASRFLAGRARAREAWADAERHLATIAASPAATVADCKELAVARGRLGKWGAAAEAWRKAGALAPAEADDPRYAARLADTAAGIGTLPGESSAGVPWTRASNADLERIMKEQSEAAAAARAKGEKAPVGDRPAIVASLAAIRKRFVAAALEYAMRGMPIRETAFGNGYAVLIFQDAAWELAAGPPAQN